MVCLHVVAPDLLKDEMERRWTPNNAMLPKQLRHVMRGMLADVMAAMAAGVIKCHASMAKADVKAAMAAVRASIPSIIQYKSMVRHAEDLVRDVLVACGAPADEPGIPSC